MLRLAERKTIFCLSSALSRKTNLDSFIFAMGLIKVTLPKEKFRYKYSTVTINSDKKRNNMKNILI
jgi:hypothetical protein